MSPVCWRSPARAILLVLSLGLPFAAPAGAARAQEADAPAAEADQEPAFIPVGNVAPRAEALEERLREIEAELQAAEVERRVEEELAEVKAEAARAQSRLDATLARAARPSELEAVGASWDDLVGRLELQEDELANRLGRLDEWLVEIRTKTELWRRTRDRARAASLPATVVQQVVQALKALIAAEDGIEAARNAALELQTRVAEQMRALEPSLERLEVARDKLAASLFVRQSEPLWRWRPVGGDLRSELGSVARGFAATGAELVDYAARHLDRCVAQLLLMLGLAWLFGRVRSELTRDAPRGSLEADPETGGSPVDALRHPWAAALLAGLFTTRLFHPDRVLGATLLTALLTLPVWLWVLRGMLPRAMQRPLVALAALALAEAVRIGLGPVSLMGRWLLAVELAAGLAAVLWLRRPSRVGQIPAFLGHSPWLRVLDAWLRLAIAGFAIGLLAVFLGYANLAARLSELLIWGSVIGASLLAIARMAQAIVQNVVEAGRLDSLRMIRSHRQRFLAMTRSGLRALAAFWWVYLLLEGLQLWAPLRTGAAAVLSAQVGYGPAAVSLGGVLAFALTLWVSWMLARLISLALEEEVFARVRMPPGVPFALTTFTRYSVLVVGFLVAMGVLGFSLDRVVLLLSAVGVGIGFGLQNVVNNFVSGVILLFERPIRVGDRVQVDDLLGEVSTIGIRASKVRTFDGSDVIVPNGDFISARVINWTLADRKRRVILPVGVAYGTKPRQVLEILEQVAHANPGVLDDPAPDALFRGFGDSSLDFELRAWTDSDRGWLPVLSDLAVATSEALEAAGISIPFPQRDLHLRNVPELRDALAEAVRGLRPTEPDETSS
jgi:small-conductance mechanosensitive channel